MYWIPTAELLIQTDLSPAEVKKMISEITEPKKAFRLLLVGSQERTLFEGTVTDREFYLERLARGAIPVKGKIESVGQSTQVKVTMRISGPTILWLGVVFVFCNFTALAIFASFDAKPIEFAPFLIPVGFYGFCLVLMIVRFNLEVKKTKTILLNVLSKEKQKDAR